MDETGWIKLHRQLRNHWIWSDPEKLRAWIDILMEANHEKRKVNLGNRLIECDRGQSLNSQGTWAKRWRWNKSAVRRFFALLQNDGMIEIESVQKTTRLTVCNYPLYQDKRTIPEPIVNQSCTEPEPILTTNKNDKNKNPVCSAETHNAFIAIYPCEYNPRPKDTDIAWYQNMKTEEQGLAAVNTLSAQLSERGLMKKHGLSPPYMEQAHNWIKTFARNDYTREFKTETQIIQEARDRNGNSKRNVRQPIRTSDEEQRRLFERGAGIQPKEIPSSSDNSVHEPS